MITKHLYELDLRDCEGYVVSTNCEIVANDFGEAYDIALAFANEKNARIARLEETCRSVYVKGE